MTEPKVRLLVVDDDAQIIRLYEDVLQREGYEVATALDVKTATAKIDELKGDVLKFCHPQGESGDRPKALEGTPKTVLAVLKRQKP